MSFDTWTLEEAHIRLIDGDRGKNYPKQADFDDEGHCLFLSAKNVTVSGFQFSETIFIGEERHGLLRAGTLNRGDIVLTTRGTIGNVALYDESVGYPVVRINSGMIIVRTDLSVWNPRFLYYVFTSDLVKDQIVSLTSGSAVPQLPARDLKRFVLPKVPRLVQDQIESVLSSLSDKIQLNHQINQTLEQMAQAIFKSWFVDFEPVKAKIAARERWHSLQPGNQLASPVCYAGELESQLIDVDLDTYMNLAAMQTISGKDADQLAQMQAKQPEQYAELYATAELFPSTMQDSELGEIPEGWDTSTVGAEFDVTMGQSPPGDTYNENGEGVTFFQGRRDFGVRFPNNRVYCTVPKRMANEGDTLLSVRAPVGDVNIAARNCCIGRGLAALRHKSGCASFTYYSILEMGHQLASFDSEGTVFGSINQKNLKALELLKPPAKLIKRFSGITKGIDGQIRSLSQQAENLSILRDTLLPRLLSGELTLPDTEEPLPELQDVAHV